MSHLLSAKVGVPIALLAMFLLFRIETSNVNRRLRPALTISIAALVIVVLLVIIATRFARYS